MAFLDAVLQRLAEELRCRDLSAVPAVAVIASEAADVSEARGGGSTLKTNVCVTSPSSNFVFTFFSVWSVLGSLRGGAWRPKRSQGLLSDFGAKTI